MASVDVLNLNWSVHLVFIPWQKSCSVLTGACCTAGFVIVTTAVLCLHGVSGPSDKHEFQAETRQLLDIVAKSLYSEKEVRAYLRRSLLFVKVTCLSIYLVYL